MGGSANVKDEEDAFWSEDEDDGDDCTENEMFSPAFKRLKIDPGLRF